MDPTKVRDHLATSLLTRAALNCALAAGFSSAFEVRACLRSQDSQSRWSRSATTRCRRQQFSSTTSPCDGAAHVPPIEVDC